jgi:hypothetical protein
MAASTTTRRLLPPALLLVALFSVAPFFRFYANNLHEDVDPNELARYALFCTAAVTAIYAVLHAALRPQTTRPPAIFAATLFALVSYYDVASGLANLGASYLFQNLSWMLLLVGAIALAATLGARRNFWLFLFAFATFGLAVPALTILRFDRPKNGPQLALFDAYPLENNGIWSGQAADRPNVYWLVADSYPNLAVLRGHYHFDNQPFLAALKARGFQIAPHSFANFSSTQLSVPTALNMEYVLDDGERYTEDRGVVHVRLPGHTNRGMMAAIAGDNRSVSFFRQLGYRYLHYEGRSFHMTRCRGYEDLCIRGAGLSELQLNLMSLLPIRPVIGWMRGREPTLTLRRSASQSGTGIPELAAALRSLDMPSPFFLYAHFSSPHAPFYNTPQCQRSKKYQSLDPQRFVEQVQCVNLHLTAIVDQIQQRDPDAIVIVSSDHGPRLSVKRNLPTHALNREQIRESLAILNAFKLPKGCILPPRPRMSPVNTMRIVFACLGRDSPKLLEDIHFVVRRKADRGVIRRVDVE